MATVTAIRRTDRPDRADWVPLLRPNGYQLLDRTLPYPDRNRTANATFVSTLTDAGDLVEKGYAIRMAACGATWGDYIYPEHLEVVRS